MKLSPLLPATLAFATVMSLARAADPVPPEQQWQLAIQTFAHVLNGTADRDELDKLLSDHSWVSPFARNRTESVAVLPERLTGQRVVSARACLQPSVTSATDLVADIQADATIDESIRRKLVPPEGHDLRGADATMSRWFTVALEAQPGESSAPGVASRPPSLTLLLIRGEFAATDNAPRMSRVLYGSLESAVR
jgi:hypothetical protein